MRHLFIILALTLAACGAADEPSEPTGKTEQAACPPPSQDPLENLWARYSIDVNFPAPPGQPNCLQPLPSSVAPGWAPPAVKDATGGQRCNWIAPRFHADCGTPTEVVIGIYNCPPTTPMGTLYSYTDTMSITRVPGQPGRWHGALKRVSKTTATSAECSKNWNIDVTFTPRPPGWPL